MRKLYRSSRDRKIFGVCGGLAEYLGVDATLLRILLIVVAVFSAGSVILVYILAGFIIPSEPQLGGPFGPGPGPGPFSDPNPRGARWSGSYNGWTPPQQSGNAAPGWTPGTPWTGPSAHAAASAAKPAAGPAAGTTASTAPGLDAMMEDIEKKALKREIEELKARITKFEQQQPKGE